MHSQQHPPATNGSRGALRFSGMAALCVVALTGCLIAWQVSWAVHGASGNPLGELLVSFGPSALFAAGRGMILVPGELPGELSAFLRGETAYFNPDTLPETLAGAHLFGEYRETFTLTHWLLFYSVGWAWRLFGTNIAALHLLTGGMGGFMAVSLYLLFRLGMNRFFACLGALFTMLLPPFLLAIPSLRDFSKGPFTLLFLAIAATILSTRRHPSSFVGLSLLLACVTGLGFGFRQDLLICLPIALLTCLAAPLHGGHGPVLRLSMAFSVFAVFLLLATPVLRGMGHESGSVTSHTLIQGLSREAEQTMGFGDAAYDLLLTPSDPEVHAVVNAHARMGGNDSPMPLYLSPAYARAGRALFLEWARMFPADLFARGIASMETNLRLSSVTLTSKAYEPVQQALHAWPLAHGHVFYANYIEPFGPFLIVCALFIIGLRSHKQVFLLLLVLGYFMAYPGLLFQIRHAFHLAFIVPWACFFLLANGTRLATDIAIPRMRRPDPKIRENTAHPLRACAKTAALLFVLVVAGVAPLLSLRLVQSHNVHGLLEQYEASPLTLIETSTEDAENHYAIVKPSRPLPGLEESWNLPVGDAATSYLALSFSAPEYAFPVRIQYAPGQGPYMTRQFIVPAGNNGDGATLFYVPIYELADFSPAHFQSVKHRLGNTPLANLLVHRLGTNTFQGIGLRKDTLRFLDAVYYVEGHRELPWLLFLRKQGEIMQSHAFKRLHLEKNMRSLPIELRVRLTGDVQQAVDTYFLLLAQHPGHRPYMERLERLIPRIEDQESRAVAFMQLSGYQCDKVNHYAEGIANVARAFSETGEFSLAERFFHMAIALAPQDLWHQVYLAEMHTLRGDAESAIALYTQILTAAPESPHSAEHVDRLLVQERRATERTQYWRNICEQHLNAAVPWHYLGQALEAEQHKGKALEAYRRALKNNPDYEQTLLRP